MHPLRLALLPGPPHSPPPQPPPAAPPCRSKKEHTERLQGEVSGLQAENAALEQLLGEMASTGEHGARPLPPPPPPPPLAGAGATGQPPPGGPHHTRLRPNSALGNPVLLSSERGWPLDLACAIAATTRIMPMLSTHLSA